MGSGGDGEDVVELQNVMAMEERMAEPLSHPPSHPGSVSLALTASLLLSSELDLHLISFGWKLLSSCSNLSSSSPCLDLTRTASMQEYGAQLEQSIISVLVDLKPVSRQARDRIPCCSTVSPPQAVKCEAANS